MPRALQPGVSRILMGQPSQLVDSGGSVRLIQLRRNVEVFLASVSDHNLNTKVVVDMQ